MGFATLSVFIMFKKIHVRLTKTFAARELDDKAPTVGWGQRIISAKNRFYWDSLGRVFRNRMQLIAY